ncbi:MAG: YwaF family protein, partial [Clostridia bacterium]|nr:YwaF family protein [Clostridia bacterium]
ILIYYLTIFLICSLVLSLGIFFHKKNQKGLSIFFKTISLVFGAIFFMRYMLGTDAIQEMFGLTNTPINGAGWNAFALILVWFTYAGNLILSLYGFFDIKRINGYVKFIALPIALLNVCFLSLDFTAVIGEGAINEYSLRGFMFALEIGIALGYALLILITKTNWKNVIARLKGQKIAKTEENSEILAELPTKTQIIKKYHQENEQKSKISIFFEKIWYCIKVASAAVWRFCKKYWFDIFAVLVIFLSVMPSYALQGLFGDAHQIYKAKDLEITQRMILYIAVILPVIIHFTLRNKAHNEKKFYLLLICLGTLLSFSFTRRFESFLDPTLWPLHLCNTAMYIMPIVLIFNMKRFFYFTYFINVLGAFLAMAMPNYEPDTINIFSSQLVNFYINHYIAFFMPLLFVSLGMFEKPKFKQFVYSMIGFLVYFVLVLVLNAMFTGMYAVGLVSSTTDFFFVNSDFIADKLGTWAENLRDITATISVGGIEMTFYPVYQVLFFLVYILLGLAMWFVYEHGYQLANSFADIKRRKQKMKLEQLALASKMNGRSLKEPMNPENSNKLILRNFSKRYGSSDVFAVKNANLEVNGGEIFGFLGPNGAGKSTIIKTIVGIQPITSGEIEVCGYDVDTQGVEAKREIGFVPDHYALYEKLTGREYINYIADLYNVPLVERNERIDNYVKRFELEGAFDNQMKTYSHGMKQKIAIMAALVHNPKIWILDEPLTGLDPNSIFQVKECMKEHAKAGNIVFFSSHIIDVVEKICDKIAIIKKGEILLSTSVEDIERDGTTLEEFYMNTINGENYIKNTEKLVENSETQPQTQQEIDEEIKIEVTLKSTKKTTTKKNKNEENVVENKPKTTSKTTTKKSKKEQ